MPADDDTLTMAPLPRSIIAGQHSLGHEERALEVHVEQQVPVGLRHLVRVGEAQDTSDVGQDRRSARARPRLRLTAARVDSADRTSHASADRLTARGATIAAAVASTSSARTSRQATAAPSAANRSAVARPMPDAAPVTIAVRPSNRAMALLLLCRPLAACSRRREVSDACDELSAREDGDRATDRAAMDHGR